MSGRSLLRGARGNLAAVMLTLLAPFVGYGILRDTSATLLWPRDPAPPVLMFAREAEIPSLKLPPTALAMARRAATSAPLAYEPFVIAARAAQDAGNRERMTVLLEEARRRKATDLGVRYLLAAEYARRGDAKRMLPELNFVFQSNEAVRAAAMPQLVKFLQTAAGRSALALAVAPAPSWSKDFFQAAAQAPDIKPADASAFILALKQARADPTAQAGAQQLYFHALTVSGRIREARQQWLTTLPAGIRSGSALVFNSGFKPGLNDDTFGWKFTNDANGRAEILKTGRSTGLATEYFGGQDLALAQETITLSPGQYLLSATTEMDAKPATGVLSWSIKCFPGSVELVTLPITTTGGTFATSKARFTVPGSGCEGQTLQLDGRAGDIAAEISAQTRQVSVSAER